MARMSAKSVEEMNVCVKEGLRINGLELLSRDQLKQLNQRVFVFVDLKSDLKRFSKNKKQKKSSKDKDQLYWAERIVSCRLNYEYELLFRIKWEGYPDSQNTWQSSRDLFDCNHLFQDFYSRLFFHSVISYDSQDLQQLSLILNNSSNDLLLIQKFFNSNERNEKSLKTMKSNLEPWIRALSRAKRMTSHEWYQRILVQEIAKQLNIEKNFQNLKNFFEFYRKREKLLKELKEWETDINQQIGESGNHISVENLVDFCVPPKLEYLLSHKLSDRLELTYQCPSVTCLCQDDCRKNRTCFCSLRLYKDNKRFKTSNVIYECNDSCFCSKDNCPNRRIQRGSKQLLRVFKTPDKGWALMTLRNISFGEYIMEYNGEVLTSAMAKTRDPEYFFNLNQEFCGQILFIDGKRAANVTRFANHSCQPNMAVHLAHVSGVDRIPRIVFFANQNIKAYEELTYDYSRDYLSRDQSTGEYVKDDTSSHDSGYDSLDDRNTQRIQIECFCGQKKCRKFI